MNKIYAFFGGRKFFLSLILLGISTYFVFTEKASFEEFSEFIIWVFGFYSVGNVGSKYFLTSKFSNEKNKEE